MNEQLKQQRNELCDLQLRLGKYSVDDERDLDPNIRQVFNGNPPDWVTNSVVFSPVIALFQSEIMELAEYVREKQVELRHLIRESKRAPKPAPRNYEAEISRLQDNISALTQFINEFSSTEYSYAGFESSSQLSALDAEIMRLRQMEDGLNSEIAALQNDLRDSLAELTNAQNASDEYKAALEKSRRMMRDYRNTLKMLEQTAQDLNKNSEYSSKDIFAS